MHAVSMYDADGCVPGRMPALGAYGCAGQPPVARICFPHEAAPAEHSGGGAEDEPAPGDFDDPKDPEGTCGLLLDVVCRLPDEQ